MEEEIKTIIGYENYEVSNFGNVKNIKFVSSIDLV